MTLMAELLTDDYYLARTVTVDEVPFKHARWGKYYFLIFHLFLHLDLHSVSLGGNGDDGKGIYIYILFLSGLNSPLHQRN